MGDSGFDLDPERPLFAELTRRAGAAGLYLIARGQSRRRLRVLVANGRTEEASSSLVAGLGLHVFTDEGYCAFGSIDGLAPEAAAPLLERTGRAAVSSRRLGASPTLAFVAAAPARLRHPAAGRVPIDAVSLADAERTALELNRALRDRSPNLAVRTSLSFDRDEWLVVRSDGTEASWVITRFVASHGITVTRNGASFTCRASVSSPHFDALGEEPVRRRLDLRARRASERAAALPTATRFPSCGAVPLLIDHALAKGLAHEAFGHAAEADQFRSSVLAREGRFRSGERVGREQVSVIDEPIRGDHADQPVSPNGEPRQRVEIVRSGVLFEALTDLFCAAETGLPSKGCDRAESYRSAPLPRMSNIRIELADPAPLPLPFDEMSAEDVRDLLGEAGILTRHPRVLYLSGYTGGQVNPVQGDFIFNCQALYELTAREATVHRPSAFRGSLLAALSSLTAGFGPLQLDAIGSCGKWGQTVPSSGGSHSLVFIEPNPSIGVGA
jgi:TldD protein